MLGRVWTAFKDAVDGLKTLGVTAIFTLLGLADYFDVVDVRPFLTMVLGEDRAGKAMVLMAVVFGTLRFISTGGVRWTRKWREEKEEAEQKEPS